MPAALSYPGVYIEEIPSGVRTITGVATSIAAFIGWAARGPTDKAQLVLSFQDYVRNYGGLDARTYLGYAVNQFFANGGNTAYVVRLAANDAKAADVTVDGLQMLAEATKRTGQEIEISERWRCPSAATLRPFKALGVPIVLSTDSHKRGTIGRYEHCLAVLRELAAPPA